MRFSLKTLMKSFLALFLLFWILYFSNHHPESRSWLLDLENHHHLAHFPKYHHHHPVDELLIAKDPTQPRDEIYPNPRSPFDDRILAQMEFVPESVKENTPTRDKVLLYMGECEHPQGTRYFQEHPCKVKSCELTTDPDRLWEADVVLFRGGDYYSYNSYNSAFDRPVGQIWVLYALESPQHTPSFEILAGKINWTATYRHDSTLVTPYEKYVPFNQSQLTQTPQRNYAAGKSKMVAWFVSNCHTANKRLEYAKKLSKYVQVDIYGGCGPLKCPRGSKECSELLDKDYKFYLAFENTNCQDYITEKFFITGLKHNVVPIVMGATPQEYRRVAPPRSFIHVEDFSSPVALAQYLLLLNKHDAAYNSYFRWKGLWRNVDTLFPCRLCALAHDADQPHHGSQEGGGGSCYPDLDNWWRGDEACRNVASVRSWMMTKKED